MRRELKGIDELHDRSDTRGVNMLEHEVQQVQRIDAGGLQIIWLSRNLGDEFVQGLLAQYA